MTTFREQVVALLVAWPTDAANRVYPIGDVPPNPVTPFIVYQRTLSAPENLMTGAPPIDNTHIQIDCFTDTTALNVQLVDQVKQAMVTGSFKCWLLSEVDGLEFEVNFKRCTMLFSLWSQ